MHIETNRSMSRVRIGYSRSSRVIDVGTNRKRVCDFLLVRHSNLGPILPRFGANASFLLRNGLLILLNPNLGVCFSCCIAHVVVNPSQNLRLLSRDIIFQPMLSRCLNATDGRTEDL